jgi:hypothetical protein
VTGERKIQRIKPARSPKLAHNTKLNRQLCAGYAEITDFTEQLIAPGAEPNPICAVAWVAPDTRLRCVARIRGSKQESTMHSQCFRLREATSRRIPF